jgi:hypothetical protein
MIDKQQRVQNFFFNMRLAPKVDPPSSKIITQPSHQLCACALSVSKSKDDGTPGKLTEKLSNVCQNLRRKEKTMKRKKFKKNA